MNVKRHRSALTILATLALPGLALAEDETGSVAGTVAYTGEVPKQSVADNFGRKRPLLQVDEKTHGLRYAVAWLVGVPQDERPAEDAKPEAVTIDQQDETFVPHLIAITAGTPVKFTNGDGANHNVHALALDERNQFNVFTPAGGSYRHEFRSDPKQRPVAIRCDVHAWMRAWVYVFDHSFHAVTDARGEFRIENVPPGRYQLVVRQPDAALKHEETVTVAVGETAKVEATFTKADRKQR